MLKLKNVNYWLVRVIPLYTELRGYQNKTA